MKMFAVACPTEDMWNHVIKISKEHGLTWELVNNIAWPEDSPKVQNLGCSDKGYLCYAFDKEQLVSYHEYLELLREFQEENEGAFHLNDAYTAKINKKDKIVTVGCQEFSFEKIKELASALD